MSYDDERRLGKHTDDFGKGAIESVAVPEAANNAAVNRAFVQALTPGILGFGVIEESARPYWMGGLAGCCHSRG